MQNAFKKLKTPIALKITVNLVLIISLVISIYTYFDIKNTRNKLENEAENNIFSIFNSSLPIIENGLWGFDYNLIDTTFKQLLKNKIIERVILIDKNGSAYAMKPNQEKGESINLKITDYMSIKQQNDLTEKTKQKKEDAYFKKKFPDKDIVSIIGTLLSQETYTSSQNKNRIGFLIVDYSTEYISKTIAESIWKSILLSFILGVAIVTSSFIYIRYSIILPLKLLERTSLKISKNEFIQINFKKSIIGEDEIDRLMLNFNYMIRQIVKFIEEQKEKQRMVNELETARIVQESLIPKAENLRVGYFEISSFFKSTSECGGDWWYFYPLPDKKILILLGDVTGHGTPSALLTAAVKGYCDSIYFRNDISPNIILEELDIIVHNSSDKDRYMTMFSGVLDPIKETITFSNAGHNFPLLISKDLEANKHKISTLTINGKRLGFRSQVEDNIDNDFSVTSIKFRTGDILFIYSDGLIEARNSKKQEYSERRLRKLLANINQKSTLEMVENVSNDLKKFLESSQCEDDVTFLFCRLCSDEDNSFSNDLTRYVYSKNKKIQK